MRQMKDYYMILGIPENAEAAEIKKAFRALARRHHPDVSSADGAEDQFKEVNEAYEILSDPQKREKYDMLRNNPYAGDGGMGFGDGGIFDDLFSVVFGDMGGRSRARGQDRRGSDLSMDLTLAFEEAVFGIEREVEIPRYNSCDVCEGTGAKPGTGTATCIDCGGAGQVRRTQQSFLGTIVRTESCRSCRGTGQLITDPCLTCKGEGRVPSSEKIKVTVPAGVEDGTTLKISQAGEAGVRGGQTGDLYIVLRVKEHPMYERHGYDLYTEIPISFSQAALGTKIMITTLDGESELEVPLGTQSAMITTIKEKGIPILNKPGRRGNLHVRLIVRTPQNLSQEEKDLLQQLADLRKETIVDVGEETLVDKFKDIFTHHKVKSKSSKTKNKR